MMCAPGSMVLRLLLCGVCLGADWPLDNSDAPVGFVPRSLWAEELSLSLLPSYSLAPDLSQDPAICARLLVDYANSSAALSGCLVRRARPVRLCQGCYLEYVQLRAIMKSIADPLQNKTLSCETSLLQSDRVQVVVILNDFFEQTWTDSKCMMCLQNDSRDLLNSTIEFMNLFDELNDCFEKNMQPAGQLQQGNNPGICKNCSEGYKKLNVLYSKLEHEKVLCIDLEDAMNSTRRLWSKTFNCTVPCKDTVPVIAVSAFILFLPIVFYLSSFLHSEQKKRKLILPKRIKSNANIQDNKAN
ncbi:osteopetrosis-associated transmembrane protein 1 isoform X2 [Ascaphus truei]|uniref:osteopetrosis-associated transmembrane protein 1 isoform X2 n=1 Tax=Ascaphus truei TaxID=8439 RepID=UPI003F5AB070